MIPYLSLILIVIVGQTLRRFPIVVGYEEIVFFGGCITLCNSFWWEFLLLRYMVCIPQRKSTVTWWWYSKWKKKKACTRLTECLTLQILIKENTRRAEKPVLTDRALLLTFDNRHSSGFSYYSWYQQFERTDIAICSPYCIRAQSSLASCVYWFCLHPQP